MRKIVCALVLAGVLFTLPDPAAAIRVSVKVEGIRGALSDNVKATLSLRRAQENKRDIDEDEIQRLVDRTPGEVALALEPFGYYRSAATTSVEKSEERWSVAVRVTPGPAIRVTSVDIKVTGPGKDEPAFRNAVSNFPLTGGDVLDHAAYQSGKTAFVVAAADSGYLSASIDTAAIWIDRAAYTSGIILHVETGPRYKFGEVTFEQDVVDPAVLRGYVNFKPGDPYRQSRLIHMQGALSGIGYFGRVEVTPEVDEAENLEVPILVEMEPQRTQSYEFGVGWGTDTGPRVSFNAQFRRLNRSGHHAEVSALFSGIENRYLVRYVMPSRHPSTWVTTLTVGFARLDPVTYTTDKFVVGPSFSHVRGKFRESWGLNYQFENYTVGVDTGTAHFILPSVGWRRARTDDPLFALHAWSLSLQAQAAADWLLSTTDIFQMDFTARVVHALTARTRLLGALQLGKVWTRDFRELPPTLRYFAGGERSLRGYEWQSLGPLDRDGNVIGGEILALGSVEVDHYFVKSLGLALFFDFGNAYENGFSNPTAYGVGPGLRWRSPVGLFRVDYGFGLEPRNDGVLHLMLGPDV
jgi:translocation and assembly module TamA